MEVGEIGDLTTVAQSHVGEVSRSESDNVTIHDLLMVVHGAMVLQEKLSPVVWGCVQVGVLIKYFVHYFPFSIKTLYTISQSIILWLCSISTFFLSAKAIVAPQFSAYHLS